MKKTRGETELLSWRKYCIFLMTALLTLSIIFIVVVPVIGKERHFTFTTNGVLDDYQWAHSSNKLAILYSKEGRPFLYVFNAEIQEYVEKISLAEPYQYFPYALGWLPDDSGLIVAMDKLAQGNEFEDHYAEFYLYTLEEKKLEKVYEHIERLHHHGIYGIVFDHKSSYWAVTYAGEGHPNIIIYQETEFVLQTEVYPNSIETLVWNNSLLYCVTGAYLEFGLTGEQRAQHPQFNEKNANGREDTDGREELAVYSIDPVTQRATQVAASPEEIKNTSFDKHYHMTVDIGENKEGWFFTITIY